MMSDHILIPKNMCKTLNMKSFFQINNTLEERRVNVATSETFLEITLYGDMMYEDKEALGIFGLINCGEHTIKYNNKTQELYLLTDLSLLKIEESDILNALHMCYKIVRERRRLMLTSILDSISYEIRVMPSPDILPIKEIKHPSSHIDQRAPDID